jgi:putative FmdB family regulatory protein
MPLYPYRCEQCGLEFEVSRPISQASNPANCPMDGTAGARIFTAPMTLRNRGQDAPPAPTAPEQKPAPTGWSHFGHSHGGGVGGHSHGTPRRPPAPSGGS